MTEARQVAGRSGENAIAREMRFAQAFRAEGIEIPLSQRDLHPRPGSPPS